MLVGLYLAKWDTSLKTHTEVLEHFYFFPLMILVYCLILAIQHECLFLEGTVDGKRGRERLRKTWFSNIRDWMGIDHATVARKSQDHDQWRSMAFKVPDGYGIRDLLIQYA